MKLKYIFLLAFIFAFNGIFAQTIADSNRIINVLTFNILHGATTKGDFKLDVIADVIKNANPDLVALQEVDFKTNRAKKYDLATELGWRCHLAPLFGKAMSFDHGEYGDAVLSKSSFLKTDNIALPFTKGREPRTAVAILTILNSGDTVAFIGTHLDHVMDETDRIAQANRINQYVAKCSYPCILAGDFNAEPGSKAIKILEEKWGTTYNINNYEFTFPSDKAEKKIDYVMFYPKNKWKTIAAKVICDAIASDHCAYLVTLELLK
jgi:endonuclease/exonuclease/phosphatase family metal-dependent hydrolase